MDKDILKIKKWRKTHEELLKFIESDNVRTGDDIRTWIAQSIVYFTEVGVPQNIVDYFLSKLDYYKEKDGKKFLLASDIMIPSGAYPRHDEEDKYYYKVGIGPFTFDENAGGYVVKDTVNRLIDSKQIDRTKMTPILVAFKVAENIIDNYEEGERVIPKSLINEFNKEETQSIYIAMQDVQNSYEKRNTKDILVPLITLTDLICSLIPEVQKLTKLGLKITKLYEDKDIREKYHLDKEVLWALNNARIIRNCDIHKPETLNGTTLYESIGYCHILVLFISSLLASGEIKL